MSDTEFKILVAVIAAAIGLCFFVYGMRFRKRGSSKTSVNLLTGQVEHEQGREPAGASVKNAVTTDGNINAISNTGSGAEIDGVKAKGDITATDNPSPDRPKA